MRGLRLPPQAAASHRGGSFASAVETGARALSGKRIGVMRQLFVGITREREIAAMMDAVVRELRAAGATVVDVSIPDLDAEYRAARGRLWSDRDVLAIAHAYEQATHHRRPPGTMR